MLFRSESRELSAQWYAGPRYRVGFLAEGGHLRIRDLFLYRQDYPSRYYDRALTGSKSVFDALPVLFPQAWGEPRAFLRLRTPSGGEPTGAVRYRALDRLTARAELWSGEDRIVAFTMEPHAVGWEGTCSLCFDRLPVLVELRGREVVLEHEGFRYGFRVDRGRVRIKGPGLEIEPEDGQAAITFGPPVEGIFRPDPPAPLRLDVTPLDGGEKYMLDLSVPTAACNLVDCSGLLHGMVDWLSRLGGDVPAVTSECSGSMPAEVFSRPSMVLEGPPVAEVLA